MRGKQRRAGEGKTGTQWDAQHIRALRRRLGLTQQQLAGALGMRQQTISEWETGLYAPRGASARLLGMIAERADFTYGDSAGSGDPEPSDDR